MKFLTLLLFSGIFYNFTLVCSEISAGKFVEFLKSDRSQKILQNRIYNSELCAKHLEVFMNGLDNNMDWSLLLYDAWGKIPTGLYSGNHYDFGNFDQCLAIKVPDMFNGQYCLVGITENVKQTSKSLRLNTVSGVYGDLSKMERFSIGFCFPDTCHPDYLKLLFNEFGVDYNITVQNSFATNCYTNKSAPLSAFDIFAITFFAIIFGTMCLSTTYEYITIKIRQNQPNRVLSLFSVYTNAKVLFSLETPKSDEIIECINAIRVLSLAWIILSHSYVVILFAPKLNENTITTDWVKNPVNMLILSATLAVDSFFLLGGLLVTKSVFKELDKTGHLDIFKMYIHRIIRITPVVATIILFVLSIYKFLGHGPLWNEISSLVIGPCERNWWSTLIYLQNYLNSSDICIDETWYLAVDMQLYLLSPLILYPLWKWRNKFVVVLPALILACIIYVFVIIYENSFVMTYFSNPDSARRKDMIYHPTHARFGVWVVGVLLGYIMHCNKSVKLDTKYIISGWFLSLGTLLAVIFGPYNVYQPDYVESKFDSPFYEPVSRVVWALALGWIIFACQNNSGGPINTFLTMPIWRPLAKLSFCMYLLHTQIQVIHVGSSRTQMHFSNYEVWYKFFGDFSITFFVSILWTLAFEMPILSLEKIMFKTENIRPPPKFNIPQINIIEDDSDIISTDDNNTNSNIDKNLNKNYLHLVPKFYMVPRIHLKGRNEHLNGGTVDILRDNDSETNTEIRLDKDQGERMTGGKVNKLLLLND